MTLLRARDKGIIALPEGFALSVVGTACSGSIQRIDPKLGGLNFVESWSVADGTMQIGPFQGAQQFAASCAAGTFEANVVDAVVGTMAKFSPQLSSRGSSSVFCATGSAVSAGMSVISQIPALGQFFAFRLRYYNKTLSAVTITIAKAACSPTHENDGALLTWLPVTFGGSTSAVIPAGTQPAGGDANDIVPGFIDSDLIFAVSLARTDDPTKAPLIIARTYFAGAGCAHNVGATDIAVYNASSASGGMQYASRLPAGDHVTSIDAYAPLQAGTWLNPVAAQFLYSVPTWVHSAVGDSRTRGQGSTNNLLGWPNVLQGLRRGRSSTLLFSVEGHGWSGQHHAAIAATAKAVMANNKPNSISMHASTPNDPVTQAAMDQAFANFLDVMEVARLAGIRFTPVTSGAVNGYNAAQNALLKAQNARIRALGIPFLDEAAIVDDPADTSKIRAEFDSGDHLHYNTACYAALAVAMDTVMAGFVP